MPRKTRRVTAPAIGAGPPSAWGRHWPGYVLTAAVAAALGAGGTYAALRPALQAAHVSPSPPALGAGEDSSLVAQGNTAFDAKNWPVAIADYTRAIGGGLDNPDIRTDLGTAYRNIHQPQQALEQYQAAQREDPHHENSLINEGIVNAFDLNNPAQALTIWQQYLTRFPHGQHVADVKKLMAAVFAASRPPAAAKS